MKKRAQNPTIGTSRRFLMQALKDYENWPEKWWREAIQNAVDAGAKKIECFAVEQDGPAWRVACLDDGRGMDASTLVGKFLVFGGSGKESEASEGVGGFGKAKELLIGPWLSWRLMTRNLVAEGVGARVTVRCTRCGSEMPDVDTTSPAATAWAREHDRHNGPETQRSTALETVQDSDLHTTSAHAIGFITKCNLPSVEFKVQGAAVEAGTKGRRKVQEFSGATAYFNKGESEVVLYRVHSKRGQMFMFQDYAPSGIGGAVLVEITKPSVDVLTANRDGIRDYTLRGEISQWVSRLAKDTRSALAKKAGLERTVYDGEGQFLVERAQQKAIAVYESGAGGGDAEDVQRVVQIIAESVQEGDRPPSRDELPPLDQQEPAVAQRMAESLRSRGIAGTGELRALVAQATWKPDFLVVNEVEGFKVPSKFRPDKMGRTQATLARAWVECCRWVLVQLGSGERFGVGFIFSESTGAAYTHDAGRDWLVLNPMMRTPAGKWSLEALDPLDISTVRWLYAAAVHECTHLVNGLSYHDEEFSSAMTANMARCADGWVQAVRIIEQSLHKRVKGAERRRSRRDEPAPPLVDVEAEVAKAKEQWRQEQIRAETLLGQQIERLQRELGLHVAEARRREAEPRTRTRHGVQQGLWA